MLHICEFCDIYYQHSFVNKINKYNIYVHVWQTCHTKEHTDDDQPIATDSSINNNHKNSSTQHISSALCVCVWRTPVLLPSAFSRTKTRNQNVIMRERKMKGTIFSLVHEGACAPSQAHTHATGKHAYSYILHVMIIMANNSTCVYERVRGCVRVCVRGHSIFRIRSARTVRG